MRTQHTSLPILLAAIFCSLTAKSLFAATPLHHYDFNGDTARDLVGSANGTLNGGAALQNGVLTMDGTTGFVQFTENLIPISRPFSVAFFAREAALGAQHVEMISQGPSGGPGFFIGFDGEYPNRQFRIGDTITGVSFPNDAAWHHYAVTVTASQTWLYVDGHLVEIHSPSAIISAAGGSTTRLGRQFDPYQEFFNGSMDDLWVFDGVLSESEIVVLSNQGDFSGAPGFGGDFAYLENGGSIIITAYLGNNGAVAVPDSIAGKPVTTIGNDAFSGHTGLITVTIPNSVTSIAGRAFAGCTGLSSVSILDSVTTIGFQAFIGCTNLASVTIPNSVTNIADFAFEACTGLTNVIIGNGVASIGKNAFSGCTNLIGINIPNNVTEIGVDAFAGCTRLASVSIQNNAITIGNGAFQDCGSLNTVSMAGGNIGNYAFANCAALHGLSLGNDVTGIGEDAFKGCIGLAAVTIPNSVTSIGNEGFVGCTSLGSVIIGDGLTYIGNVFAGCGGLTNVVFGNSVTGIGDFAFSDCTNLASITIPNGVTSIGGSAFSGCRNLSAVSIPNSVTSIGYAAFYVCTGLTSVTLGNGTTDIGDFAFSNCSGLTSLTLPDSVVSIGGWAFQSSGLTSMIIPRNVISIGRLAFEDCNSLTSISVDPLNAVYSDIDGVLFNKSQSDLIQYPRGKVGSYVVPSSVTSIGFAAFYGCTGLTSVNIPISVTSIDDYAFYGCTNLTNITVDPGNAAYSDIDGVLFNKNRTVLLCYPGGKMGSYAIPNTATSIGRLAFGGCARLTGVKIPNSVTSIGDYAFTRCTGLTSIIIPNRGIGQGAFDGCSSLSSVTLPASLTSFGEQSFYGCASLRSVYFLGNAPGGDPSVFTYADRATAFYRAGTTGWGSTYAGLPAVLWLPTDDLDHDGMNNQDELLAGTDPLDASSLLTFESVPRPSDLVEADRTDVPADQHALYFQSIPGLRYEILSSESLGAPWTTAATVSAATSQKRALVDKPAGAAFYRIHVLP